MKLAISGAHGVGKTTLVNALTEKLNMPQISEIVRIVAHELELGNCNIIQASEQDIIQLFQTKIFYQQLLAEREQTDFVSDRSIFDIVAYMEYYNLPTDLVEQYLQHAIKNSANYDAIIYCPVPKGAELEADSFRLTDGQKEYDFILKRLLFQAECRVVKLTRDRDQWFDRVLAISPVKKYSKARKSA